MQRSTEEAEGSLSNQRNRSRWTPVWLSLVVIALIGHTASLYIPAFVGISPADSDPTQAPARILGALLWPTLAGMLIQKLRSGRKFVGAICGVFVAVLLYFGSFVVAAQNS
jgi:hypothetical protein